MLTWGGGADIVIANTSGENPSKKKPPSQNLNLNKTIDEPPLNLTVRPYHRCGLSLIVFFNVFLQVKTAEVSFMLHRQTKEVSICLLNTVAWIIVIMLHSSVAQRNQDKQVCTDYM